MQNQIKWRTSLIVMKWSICVQIAISSTKQVMVYRDTKRYMNSLSILKTNCLLLERTTLRYAEHLWNVHCYFETQMMHIGGNRVTTNVKLHMLLSRLGKTQQVSVKVFGLHQMNPITNNGVRVHVELLCKLGGMGKIFQIYNLQDIMFRELHSWLKLKRKLNNRICKPCATRKNWDREKHLTFWKWSLN